jgi:hypothetical protein
VTATAVRRALVAALIAVALPASVAPAAGAAEPGAARPGGPVLARAYEVRFRALNDAADLVASVLSPEGTLTLQPKLRTIVVQDRAAVLDRVGSLLQSFDLPPRNAEVTLSLFLGTDRRDEEAGRQAQPEGLSREVRGVTETLGDVTKWNAFELLGSRSVVGVEGAPVTVNLSDDYRVTFEVASVSEPMGVITFRTVSLKRVGRGVDGVERVEDIVTTSIVLPKGRQQVIGAAKSPDSRKALFLALQARPR